MIKGQSKATAGIDHHVLHGRTLEPSHLAVRTGVVDSSPRRGPRLVTGDSRPLAAPSAPVVVALDAAA